MAKVTPNSYLEAPTVSPIIPNSNFASAFYVEKSYSFATHSDVLQLKLLDLSTHRTSIVIEDDCTVTHPLWLNDKQVVWLSQKQSGNTSVMITNVYDKDQYIAGTIPGPASDLKIRHLRHGTIAVAVAVKVNHDGKIHNPKEETGSQNSAKYYTSIYVRYYDRWVSYQRNAIFYGVLEIVDEQQRLSLSSMSNACPPGVECPISEEGGRDDFDLSPDGVILVTKARDLNPSLHTKCDCLFIAIPDFKKPDIPRTTKIPMNDLKGSASFPIFSPSGESLVLLKMERDRHFFDTQRILLIHGLASNVPRTTEISSGGWNLYISHVQFYDESTLLIQAHDAGKHCAYMLPIKNGKDDGNIPQRLQHSGSVLSAESSATGQLLIAQSNFCQPVFAEIIEPPSFHVELSQVIQLSHQFLASEQITEVWSQGATREIHGFLLRPSNFHSNSKYPVAILIHGGPKNCFTNAWRSHFNLYPQLFAEAGYIVVLPQITGTQGYGQAFMDRISDDWTGDPYEDVVGVFEYIKTSIPEADTTRAILGGLSYGGLLTNFIQGQDLGREFKALFTLNGIFSSKMLLATDEMCLLSSEFGWLPDSAEWSAALKKSDPSAHIANWATPHLIIHSGKDYRCGVENGLSAFNILQTRDIPSAYLYFDDEPHVINKPENLRALYQIMFRFLNPFVGLDVPAPEPGEETIFPIN